MLLRKTLFACAAIVCFASSASEAREVCEYDAHAGFEVCQDDPRQADTQGTQGNGRIVGAVFGLVPNLLRGDPNAAARRQAQRTAVRRAAEQRAHDLNEAGVGAYSAGDYRRARDLFEQAIAAERAVGAPPDPTILSNIQDCDEQLRLQAQAQARAAQIEQEAAQERARVARAQAEAAAIHDKITRSLDGLARSLNDSSTAPTVAGAGFRLDRCASADGGFGQWQMSAGH